MPGRSRFKPFKPGGRPRLSALILTVCVASGAPRTALAGELRGTVDDAQHQRIDAAVVEASRRFGLPTTWIYAVMRAESAGRSDAVSAKGAMGLMQLMPGTWRDLRTRLGLAADPFEPRNNILAGAAYLRDLHDRFGAPGFLAAYNAGPKRYRQYVYEGRGLPAETRDYVVSVSAQLGMSLPNAGSVVVVSPALPWTAAPLFTREDRDSGGSPSTSSLLFARSASTGAR